MSSFRLFCFYLILYHLWFCFFLCYSILFYFISFYFILIFICYILFYWSYFYCYILFYFILLLGTNACPACQNKIHERHASFIVIQGHPSSFHYIRSAQQTLLLTIIARNNQTIECMAAPVMYVPSPSFPYLSPRSLFFLLSFSLPCFRESERIFRLINVINLDGW